MAGSMFGKIFRVTTFGESHGPAIGVVIDGCPAGVEFQTSVIQERLDLRKPGTSRLVSERQESDHVEILSGVFEGRTTGAPIAFLIENRDQRSSDYEKLRDLYRPGHADLTYDLKFGARDWRGGGRASARETAARVAAGALAEHILNKRFGVEIVACVDSVGDIQADIDYASLDRTRVYSQPLRCPDTTSQERMVTLIEELKMEGDSIGGTVACLLRRVPAGLGEPIFDRLPALLAHAMLSINATKGFEIGQGFSASRMRGSEHNDPIQFRSGAFSFSKNDAGGVLGGISTGADIYFRVAFKPPSSISKSQKTVTAEGAEVEVEVTGRHDPCIVPRAVPVVEAMAALVILDLALLDAARRNVSDKF